MENHFPKFLESQQPSTLKRRHLTSSESFTKWFRNVRNAHNDLQRMSNARTAVLRGWDGSLASPRCGFRGQVEASSLRLERFKVRTVETEQVVKQDDESK
ncbi:hypothetical protein SLEP1_g11342 [Rubroshorea leprosula]|uniref:Uncharacterized protein n=1 Tax=Rubroshorea leprosula TaxID=152421 RepID=A0AAV5IK91_9ROSI|nr:hypothetical protein SLEP1_g11342 [Rubroshorea leprosula]